MSSEEDNLTESSLFERIYNHQVSWPSWGIYALVPLVVGIILNTPLSQFIHHKIDTAIRKNRSCPIEYDDLIFHWFTAKMELDRPVLSRKCLGSRSLILDYIRVSPSLPSLFPPGLKFHTAIKSGKTNLNIFPLIKIGGKDIRITDSKIDAALISNLLQDKIKLKGLLNLDVLATFNGNQLAEVNINASSKNFAIPGQKMARGFLDLPPLILKDFVLKTQNGKKNVIKVINLTLGNDRSPLFAKFKGEIKLNHRNLPASEIELIGELKFSDDFQKTDIFSGISGYLDLKNKKKSANGFYNLRIFGLLNSIKSPQFF